MVSSSSSNSNATFYGRYSDGRTAAARDVELQFGRDGVEIRFPDQLTPIIWPYASLSTAEPLSEYAIDALMSSSVEPAASLFATEGAFARRLAFEAPQLTAGAQRWRHARPWIAATVTIGALIAALAVLDLSPAHTIATLLPDKARMRLGDHAIASMAGDRRVCDDAKGVAALTQLTEKLSKAAGKTSGVTVTVFDWGLLNAFAVPGQRIITTRKLIAKAESADEVAGIISHEIGHEIELHAETGLVRAIGLSAAVELMMGGSGGTLANLGIALATLSYSRDAERDADSHALRIMKNAGISPKGLSAFFTRLKQEESGNDSSTASKAFDLVSSHPNTAERIAKINAQADYPTKPALNDEDWAALKGICGPPQPGMDTDGDGQDDAASPGDKDAPKKDQVKPKAPPSKAERAKSKPKSGRDI